MNPYLTDAPTLLSFSGGRTSAYMLHQTLAAYGGALPEHVTVAFANTGKEREETLRFVHECGERWSVRVHWVEWRPGRPGFEEVGLNSASRKGEPFAAVIAQKQFVPDGFSRFCTKMLKVHVMRKLMVSLGHKRWLNMVGLRYDEGMRVMKQLDRNAEGKERWTTIMPLSKAKVTKREVMAFWAAQPFDLQLQPYEGNCDLCFLKGRNILQRLMRDNPGMADWWIEQEAVARKRGRKLGARFVQGTSYAKLVHEIENAPEFPTLDQMMEEYDVECGLTCT